MKKICKLNKTKKIGDMCVCPSCGNTFQKTTYHQIFCKTFGGTVCKDKYWNTITPEKRNNTTRGYRNRSKVYYDIHPFSSEGLGQWDD